MCAKTIVLQGSALWSGSSTTLSTSSLCTTEVKDCPTSMKLIFWSNLTKKRTKSLSTSLTNLNRLKFLKGHRLNVTKNEVIHLFSCPSHSPSMLGKCLTSCRHSVKMWRSAITSGRACSSCARAPEPRSTSTTQAGLRRSTAAMQSMLWMMAGSPVRSQKS